MSEQAIAAAGQRGTTGADVVRRSSRSDRARPLEAQDSPRLAHRAAQIGRHPRAAPLGTAQRHSGRTYHPPRLRCGREDTHYE
jgi:hypothetical protein